MKKMLLATLALLITVNNRRLLFKTNRQQWHRGNHHPSFLRFWNQAGKLSMQPKFVAAQKMLLKQKPANIRKWIARFYYFSHSPLEARVYCSQ